MLPLLPLMLPMLPRMSKRICHDQTLITFEGFRPNGLQIRIQRSFLHIVACVKIDFGAFWEMSSFSMVSGTFNDIR